MKAGDVMTRKPVAIEATRTVQDAYDEMNNADLRHRPVLSEGAVIGIVSDRDLKIFLPSPDEQARNVDAMMSRLQESVRDVMRSDVIAVDVDTELSEVVDLMLEEKIGAIPVTDPISSKLEGIISYVDVLKAARDLL